MPRVPKYFRTEEELQELRKWYVEEEMPTTAISKKVGCSVPTVISALKRAGVEVRDNSTAGKIAHKKLPKERIQIDEEEFRRLWPTMRVYELQEHFGVSYDTVHDRAKKLGLTRKGLSDSLRKETSLKKRGVPHHNQVNLPETARPLMTPESARDLLKDRSYTYDDLVSLTGMGYMSIVNLVNRYGLRDLVKSLPASRYEEELSEIFSTWDIPFVRNTRSVLGNGQELDFYFPEHNVAVEFNGLYWHSTDFRKTGYHLAKTQLAREKGIRLIHVWEHLWREEQKKKIYVNMIRHALGLTEHRVGARKTRVEKRRSIEMKPFFLENNIQGYRTGRYAYVLVDKKTGEDLMCYTVGHAHFGKGKYDLEIARGACKLGYHVPGGATKLWKAILEDLPDINSIVYYVDLNHYNGASVGILPGSDLVAEQPSFWNWWLEDDTVRNREPQRHKEIVQGYKDGSIKMIDNAGTATYVWEREQ